jgi:hypothetical protein
MAHHDTFGAGFEGLHEGRQLEAHQLFEGRVVARQFEVAVRQRATMAGPVLRAGRHARVVEASDGRLHMTPDGGGGGAEAPCRQHAVRARDDIRDGSQEEVHADGSGAPPRLAMDRPREFWFAGESQSQRRRRRPHRRLEDRDRAALVISGEDRVCFIVAEEFEQFSAERGQLLGIPHVAPEEQHAGGPQLCEKSPLAGTQPGSGQPHETGQCHGRTSSSQIFWSSTSG